MNNVLVILVSFFAAFFDNEPLIRALQDVISLANSSDIKNITLDIRRLRAMANDDSTEIDVALRAKEQAGSLKKKLPAFMTNVVCEHGKKREHIVRFLPFLGFDIDHISEERVEELMGILSANPSIVLAQPSCSRHGLHLMVYTDADSWLNQLWDGKDLNPYRFVWNKGREYIEVLTGEKVDMNCQNPEHVFGICYDELIYSNNAPQALHIEVEEYAQKSQNTVKTTEIHSSSTEDEYQKMFDDASQVTMQLVSKHIDITEGYDNWVRIGFALANGLDEWGRSMFHDLSRMNPDYKESVCDKQYDQCLKGRSSSITIATFFQKAKEAGIDISAIAKERQKRTRDLDVAKTEIASESAKSDKMSIVTIPKKTSKMKKNEVEESKVQDSTLTLLAQPSQQEESDFVLTESGMTFSDKIMVENLPSILQVIYEVHPDPVSRDKMLLAVLNLCSTILARNYYGIYDRRRVYSSLYNIIYGPFASSKGEIEATKFILYPIKKEMRQEYEEEMAKYQEEMAEWEATPKKERGPQPKEPKFRSPYVPANSSSSAVYRTLEANGGNGQIFDAEADTMTNVLSKSEYGDYSDLLRKAHHHETISMVRVGDGINIEIENPRLSVFLTCTGSQIPLLLPSSNISNGLASRFLFYGLPKVEVKFRDVFKDNDCPIEDVYKNMGEQLLPLYHALCDHGPIQFLLTKAQQEIFVQTYDLVLREQYDVMGDGIQGFILRNALQDFRHCMILTALRKLSDWNKQESIFEDDEQAMVCDDRDFETAMTIVNCLVNHTDRVYAVIGKDNDDPFTKVDGKVSPELKKFYEALPAGREFQTAEALDAAKKLSINERTAKRYLGELSSKFLLLDHPKHGVYSKKKRQQSN